MWPSSYIWLISIKVALGSYQTMIIRKFSAFSSVVKREDGDTTHTLKGIKERNQKC